MIKNLIDQINTLKEKGFFHLAVSNYSVQFIVFSSHLLIAKIMSPNDVGVIKSIETFVSIGAILGAGGAMLALMKLVPETKDNSIRNFILNLSTRSTIVVSTLTVILFFILIYLGSITNNLSSAQWYYVYSLIIVPTTLTQLFTRYYQSTDNFKRISTITLLGKLFCAIIVLLCTYYFFIGGYVISMLVTTSILLLFLVYDLKDEFKLSNSFSGHKELKARFRFLTNSAFKSQIIDQLKLNAGFIVAFIFIKDEIEFGHYAFALILVQGLNVFVSSIQQFVIPKLSEISFDEILFFNKLHSFEKVITWFSIGVFVFTQLSLSFWILFFFGEQYRDAIPLVRIMLVGWLIMTSCSISGISFVCLGKMKYITYSATAAFVFSIPFTCFLTIKYSALGAAIAFSVQSLINNLSIRHYLKMLKNRL